MGESLLAVILICLLAYRGDSLQTQKTHELHTTPSLLSLQETLRILSYLTDLAAASDVHASPCRPGPDQDHDGDCLSSVVCDLY